MKHLTLSLFLLTLCLQGLWANFDSADQTTIIAAALKNYYSVDGSLELLAVTPLAALEKAPTSVELLEVPQTLTSTLIIKARYLNGSEPVGTISGTFRAQLRINAFVPRRQVARNNALNPADFEVQPVDRLSLKQIPVDASTNLADYEASSQISAGTPLSWNSIKPLPLVRKGALVDVIAHEGALKITTRAIATSDAGRGEQVVMRNPNTNRSFEAYVVNENLVQIRF